MTDVALHEVLLRGVPVNVHAAAQEHGAELMREMYLIAQQLHAASAAAAAAAGAADAAHAAHAEHLPVRLVRLVEALTGEFAGWTATQDRQLEAAVASGAEAIDLVYELPVGAGGAAEHLGHMLDDADEYCRAGQHLLTLATPPELVRYRRWYLGEFVAQLAGRPAVGWRDYEA